MYGSCGWAPVVFNGVPFTSPCHYAETSVGERIAHVGSSPLDDAVEPAVVALSAVDSAHGVDARHLGTKIQRPLPHFANGVIDSPVIWLSSAPGGSYVSDDISSSTIGLAFANSSGHDHTNDAEVANARPMNINVFLIAVPFGFSSVAISRRPPGLDVVRELASLQDGWQGGNRYRLTIFRSMPACDHWTCNTL